MNDDIKEKISEQIKLLVEKSKSAEGEVLTVFTSQITILSIILHQLSENDERTWHPLYGWLSKTDLENLKLAREERLRRLEADRIKQGIQVRQPI